MKSISEQEQRILDLLVFENKLPSSPYDITEEHLIHYMHAYVEVLHKKPFNLRMGDYRYTRKLAGLTLLKHNVSLGAKINEIKAGIVYMIENPAYPLHFKIGMTVDLDSRLNQYQTYDPFRQFKVKHYEFVLNRKASERQILSHFNLSLESGEWILKDNGEQIFRNITFKYQKVLAK